MKRTIQKKQRPGRQKPKGRISSIAKQKAGANKSHVRRKVRHHDDFPNSTKVGAGDVTARRSLPNNILHKRDHRSNVIIGTDIHL
jgi:hypothetical protein